MLVTIVWLLSLLPGTQPSNMVNTDGRQVGSAERDSISIYRSLNLSTSKSKYETGVLNLESGGQSLVTRLWMVREAQKTIDLQYFSFARNLTGLIATQYLVAAAERGVKIRVLVDELSGRMNAREIKILDRHENIEVRVYNAGVKLGRVDKKLKYLFKNRNRLLRRMHNKTFIVDGVACIMGGRNISDEYFDYDDKYNFRDRDALLFGEAVKDVTRSFDAFWQSELTVAVKELVGKNEKQFSVDALFAKLHEFGQDTAKFSERMRQLVDSFPIRFKEGIDKGEFQWTENASFVSDVPGKNEDRKNRKGGVCDDSIIQLIKNAKHSIDVNTPYFVTTEEARALLKETVARGVKIRIITNSLASIDNDMAFSPYKRDRRKNLATGIELYEFRPDAAERFKLMSSEVQAEIHYDPMFGLHAKSIVIDGELIVIGSYNLEPRSTNLNTECVIIVRNKTFTQNVLKYLQNEFQPENSWKVTPDFNPDKKAPLKKRIKVFMGNIVPKGQL